MRKPIVRFSLACGREIELLGFHLEPAWAFNSEPRLLIAEISARLYPNETPVIVGQPDQANGPAFLCIAYFYSSSPTRRGLGNSNFSSLLACGLVENIDKGIRGLVSELLSQVDWDAKAADDFLW